SGQPVVLEHPPDVQALDRDKPVSTDQLQGNLVVVLSAEPRHPGVDLRDLLPRLPAVLPTLPLPGERSLGTPERGEGRLLVAGIRLPVAVGGREERLQSDVDADRRIRTGLDLDVPEVTGEDDVPVPGLALKAHGLDLAFDRPVHL